MSLGSDQFYVTFVANDENLLDALVLAESLRRTFTHRKIVAIHDPHLSSDSIKKLNASFDGVFQLGNDFAWKHDDWETCAKIYCWSIPFSKKCVFISSGSLVLENCDKLFDYLETTVAGDNIDYTSILIVETSMKTYYGILDFMKQPAKYANLKDKFEAYLRDHLHAKSLEKNLFNKWNSNQRNSTIPLLFQFQGGRTNNASDFEKAVLEHQKECTLAVKNKNVGPEMANRFKSTENESIAIIGISCRFPQSNSLEEFWNLMMTHGDGITNTPSDRWSSVLEVVTEIENRVPAGWLKCPINKFDEKFFGISPYELSNTDPQQRFLLELSWEALEDAAINVASLYNTPLGIFTGIWTHNYQDLLLENGFKSKDFFRSYMGNAYGTASGRIAHFLNSNGPNICTESGCSSSMVAVGLACESLRKGTSNVALAAGVNIFTRAFGIGDLQNLCAPDGHSKTFDSSADGFGRAEGCAVLVLKRLSDAVKDGDRIQAIIRGYGASQEGTSGSIGTPSVDGEALAMELALKDGNVNPADVSFIEAHGTGTPVGDPLEIKAIAKVYGTASRPTPLVIGSVKTNIGHTESCSGIAGILKTVLSFKNNMIPPHRSLENLNPLINLDSIPAVIPLEPQTWAKNGNTPRLAGVSSFGITGTDAHVILEETPTEIKPFEFYLDDSYAHNIITISAKSQTTLDELLIKYQTFLLDDTLQLNDVAYTANHGRTHFNHRAAIVSGNCTEASKKLQQQTFNKKTLQEGDENAKVCFLFTGQGSQYHGMGKQLYDKCPVFKDSFDHCDAILQAKFKISIKDALWGENVEILHNSLYSQTSIFVIEYCLMQMWESWGITPDCVLGHSLGEFAAAVCAGILKLEDAITLVGVRSTLINSLPKGKMIVAKANEASIKHMLKMFTTKNPDLWLDFAALNSHEQTTLSGTEQAVLEFAEFCKNSEIKTHVLNATHAFHSRMMDPMLDEYRKAAVSIKYSEPKCRFISSVVGKAASEINADYWVAHTREAVQFEDACAVAYNLGARITLEIGPNPVLSALFKQNIKTIENADPVLTLLSMKNKSKDWNCMLESLAELYVNGHSIDWKSFHRYQKKQKIALPLYPFNRKSHWIDFEKRLTIKLKSPTSPSIHPIIGWQITSPCQQNLFQNFINQKTIPYVVDHKLGNHIVFPGSAYLEMSLSAGIASLFSLQEHILLPVTSIILQNLQIKSPLVLKDNQTYELQTLVNSVENSSQTKVVTYSRRREILHSDIHKWTCHSEATFSCSASDIPSIELPGLDYAKKLITQPVSEDIYPRLSALGYKFGPEFQSLKKIWKTEDEMLAEIKLPQEETKSYICHPVVADAMIQACLFSSMSQMDSLQLPIAVKTFVWLQKSSSTNNFIHVFKSNPNSEEMTAVLYDATGEVLAYTQGVELLKTTLSSFEKGLEINKKQGVPLFVEYWQPRPLDNSTFTLTKPFLFENHQDIIPVSEICNAEVAEIQMLDNYICLGLIKTLRELGLEAINRGDTFEIRDLMKKLNIMDSLFFMVRHFCKYFVEDDWVKQSKSKPNTFKLKQDLPNVNSISETMHNLTKRFKLLHKEFDCAQLFLSNMSDLLTGKKSALSLLFPEESSKVNANTYYSETLAAVQFVPIIKKCFNQLCDKIIKNQATTDRQHFRVLEIGGGTGSTSEHILSVLQTTGVKYVYHFTDISSAFFPKAKSTFQEYSKSLEFHTLNIEEDPTLQGFVPGDYDFVICSNVLHATKNLTEAVNNIRTLLKPFGMLYLFETYNPLRHVDIAFGHLDGYWRFNDFDIRPNHCTINREGWLNLFKKCGFPYGYSVEKYGGGYGSILAEADGAMPIYKSPENMKKKMWICFSNKDTFSSDLISKISFQDRMVLEVVKGQTFKKVDTYRYEINPTTKTDFESLFHTIRIENPTHDFEGMIFLWALDSSCCTEKLTESYLYLTQTIIGTKFQHQPRIFMVTEGQMYTGDQDPIDPIAATLLGLTRTFGSEMPAILTKTIDIEPHKQTESVKHVFAELWKNDKEALVSYRQGMRHVGRLKSIKSCMLHPSLEVPSSDHYSLVLPKTKSIADLKFISCKKPELQRNEVEVQIKASALNFKDIFNVLKPTPEFEKSNSVGADFAGVVIRVGPDTKLRKVGDYVIGCNIQNASLPSHVTLAETQLGLLPHNWTCAEGATLPCVFATAYECFFITAKLNKGDTILIHAGSGGVGLCAIQLAKLIGANIITTAGSRRKRAYLKSLGIQHVFNSRTLDYGQEIMKVTNNQGIDYVLNSLTGPGFKETTLKCCKQNATFVEMSKLNIWAPEEVKSLRPDVKYTIVDLSVPDVALWEGLMNHLSKFLLNNKMSPLPYTTFSALDVRDALKYLERARHIGKVVCLMPDVTINHGLVEVKTNLFNEFSSYLITGGLKGIGLEVAKWMAHSGAKNIVLCGRSQACQETLNTIEDLKREGTNVVVINADVGKYEDCQAIFKTIKNKLPPLRGVMHSAGCLSDAIIANQTMEKFEITMNPKVKGGWNLHLLTKDLNLEHFVVFSSVSCILGHPGQSNHCASNSYLDALAQYRNALGLPSTSVNWGQWGETGVAVDKKIIAFNPFLTAHGINTLEHVLRSNSTQVTACDGDVGVWKAAFQWGKAYMQELKALNSEKVETVMHVSSEEFWAELNSTNDSAKHYEIIQSYLSRILAVALKLEEKEKMDKNQDFQEFGMDSLMMIEFRNHIQHLLGSEVTLNANDMADSNNLDQLTNQILKTIFSSKAKVTDDANHALTQLIKEDSILWDHIRGDGKTVKPSQVKTVLLTGSTGFLGPYMLRDITLKKHVQKVYCLVRGSKTQSTMEKLRARLIEAELLDEVDMSKVETISGDVAQIALGMSEDAYEKLAAEVEAVVHCAVYANHLESYRKVDTKHANLRAVNVIGTQRVLEFASNKRTKLVYHASTAFAMGYGVVTRFGSLVPEDWPEEEHHDTKTSFGYMISKFIADRLVAEAVKNRNIPCKSFRFAKVGGDSRDGRQAVKTNHFFMKFLCYLKSGVMPDLDLPLQLVAVDTSAQLTLDIFFSDETPFTMYNVLNPHNHNEKEIAQLGAEFGFDVKYVPFDDFSKKIDADGEKSLLYHWSAFYSDPTSVFRLYEATKLETPIIESWKHNKDFFAKGNLAKYIPNIYQVVESPIDLLRREIKYAIDKLNIFNK